MFTANILPASNNQRTTSNRLSGTLPVRPFHPDGFVGALQGDGQQVRVAALSCDEDGVVALSLVGFDTSVGAVLARLWSRVEAPFQPEAAWHNTWQGPYVLKRLPQSYKQCVARLEGTREVHALAFLCTAHLTEGILHPPDLPEMSLDVQDEEQAQTPAHKHGRAHGQQQPQKPVWTPRYVLSNWDEGGPHLRSFLGHLYALRLLFLHRHSVHPEWVEVWAETLWERAMAHELIVPLPALGMKAWKLSGDLLAWNALVGDGIRTGWLPWKEPEPTTIHPVPVSPQHD